jgi:ABC-2 type transport system permease protein
VSERTGDRPHPLVELTLSRWRVLYRDPGVLFWIVGFPLLLAIVLGVAFRSTPEGKTAIAVLPCGDEAALVRALEVAGVEVVRLEGEAATRALRAGRVALLVARDVVGPARFTFDPARPEAKLARLQARDALERAAGRSDLTSIDEHAVTEAGNRYIDFLIPGLLGLSLMGGGLWGIGYAIVDLRVKRLLRRMVATPMKRSHFLISFGLLRLFIVAVEVPVLLGCGMLVFGVPFRGGWLAFVVTVLIGGATFAALGMLLASRAQNIQTIGGLINFVSMPLWLGSGAFFSIERFPAAARPVLALLPLTPLNDAMRAILLDGAGLVEVGPKLLVVSAWGTISFVVALAIFRWR